VISKVIHFIQGIVILAIFVGCNRPAINEQTTLATIGDNKISVHDFRISYELSPATPITLKNKNSNKKKAQ